MIFKKVLNIFKTTSFIQKEINDYSSFQFFKTMSENKKVSFISVGDSMEPTINNGERVNIFVNDKSIKVGDLVAFFWSKEKIIVIHRVKRVIIKNKKLYYLTKGDNLKISDKNLFSKNYILGTVC